MLIDGDLYVVCAELFILESQLIHLYTDLHNSAGSDDIIVSVHLNKL